MNYLQLDKCTVLKYSLQSTAIFKPGLGGHGRSLELLEMKHLTDHVTSY